MEKAAKEQEDILFVAESDLWKEEDHVFQELLKSKRYRNLLYKFRRKKTEQHEQE